MNIKHAFIALLAATGCAWAVPHYENLDKALAQAPAENRSILLDFTGTDWCPACIHLSNKILNSPEFDAAVGSRYGIVTLDFPRTKKLLDAIPPQEMKARERLLNEYRVQGLPTVVLLDSAGLPYAVLVGSAENTEQYLARLKEAGVSVAVLTNRPPARPAMLRLRRPLPSPARLRPARCTRVCRLSRRSAAPSIPLLSRRSASRIRRTRSATSRAPAWLNFM